MSVHVCTHNRNKTRSFFVHYSVSCYTTIRYTRERENLWRETIPARSVSQRRDRHMSVRVDDGKHTSVNSRLATLVVLPSKLVIVRFCQSVSAMENLLVKWGLKNLIAIFKENDITLENITDITNDHLKELKVSIGHRIIFKNKIQLYKENKEAGEKIAEKKIAEKKIAEEKITEEKIVEEKDLQVINKDVLQNILNMDVIFQDVHQSDNTKSSDTENPKATTSNETNEDNENLILIDTINVLSNVECSHFLNFDLKNLLISSPYGNSILKYYQKNNLLTFSLRAKLVNIIVRHLYTYIIKHRLTHSQFQLITSKILSLFPNECGSTYYIPAVPKNLSPTGRPVMAREKLVDKCRNMLYTSDDIQYVRKRKCQSENSDEVEEIILDQDIKSDVSWLKYNIEPWDEVIEKWRRTFEVRKNSKTTNFNAFLKEWAPLKHKDKAECLINIDFDLLFPDKNLKLYEGWNSFIDKILNTNKRTDTNIQNLIHNRQSGTISEDGRFINDIHLLANIVPPKGRILIETDSGRKQWKFSTIESIEAIIVHCKSHQMILDV
ncbi:uncharacterized protein LOC143907596 isoform X3 [Temnothorax americanus]|uniref:uncharacterized protein LOC143907596 isoform X3 n=1 Tax=Temnothorax americanus TaxID=1964332 RepID=UPI0040689ACA